VAVLFDRDGTLVHDVPYNPDPAAVRPLPGVREALDRLRAAGVRVGVVTNQSGIGRGLLTAAQVAAVNARVEELLGPFDVWAVCPHDPAANCRCRKPRPGMVLAALAQLDAPPARSAVVGDIGADVAAALAAGARPILVPTDQTLPSELASAPEVCADLSAAVDALLGEGSGRGRVLVARLDSTGDVLVSGPAVRAVAAHAGPVVMLCGPRGAAAARLLPGVDRIIVWSCPWIEPDPAPIREQTAAELVDAVRANDIREALILTSYHQSPLPLALLLRLAGVGRVSAISEDYPGSLLDVRHRVDDDLAEPERAVSLAAAAGFSLPQRDRGRLAVRGPLPDVAALVRTGPYVVVHPGASVPARAWPPDRCGQAVRALADEGRRVVVTGSPDEAELTGRVAGDVGVDLGGRTNLAELAAVLAGADAVVVANTGPAHLAAAVGTPVVSLFAPTVPADRWAPYGVPRVLLGDQDAPCRGSRARVCPVPGHPCLSRVTAQEVVAAVDKLTGRAS
jgi:HAD superfamily hydrolase (TIGR01662 family)